MKNLICLMLFLIIYAGAVNNTGGFIRKKTKLIKRVSLQENNNLILTSINNVALNSSSGQILISDNRSGNIVLYNAITGKIIKSFSAGVELSDSIALKGNPTFDSSYYFLTSELTDKNGNPYSEKYLKKWIKNKFYNAVFQSDSVIIISAYINPLMVDLTLKEGFQKGLDISTAFIIYNLNENNYRIYQVDKSKYVVPQVFTMLYDYKSNECILNCTSHYSWKKRLLDSLWIISSYSLEGKIKKTIAKLPEDYVNSGLGYVLSNPSLIFNNDGEIIGTFKFSLKIYNFNRNETYKLKNLPASNKASFEKIKSNPEFLKKGLIDGFPVRIKNIYLTETGSYLVYLYYTETDSNKRSQKNIIQEYTPAGELAAQAELPVEDEYGVVHQICYSKPEKALLIFQKSDTKGWTLTYRSWN